jgi:hypothetical protein
MPLSFQYSGTNETEASQFVRVSLAPDSLNSFLRDLERFI